MARFTAKVSEAIQGLVSNPGFWGKATASMAAGAAAGREYEVMGEDFTVGLTLTPREFTRGITAPIEVIGSTIYTGSAYFFSKKLEMLRRGTEVARALKVVASQGEQLSLIFVSISDDINLLAKVEDLDEARSLQAQITAKSLKAQRLTFAMEADTNALLYLNKAGQDDIILAQLREARGGLQAEDIALWQQWIDNPPKGLDNELVGILRNLADPDDLFGIKQTVNQSKAANATMIELLTRSENLTTQAKALLDRAAGGKYGLPNMDELQKALKAMQQGDVAASFATASDDMTRLIPNLQTISSAAQRAEDIGQKAAFQAKTVGRFFLWDTVYWIVTTGIDVALNPFLDERRQRIPYFADLPVIGGLFDVSESVGTSPLNLIIEALLPDILGFLIPDSIQASFYDLLAQATDTDDLSAWYVVALSWWYDLGFDVTLPDFSFDLGTQVFEIPVSLPPLNGDVLDILAVATVACVGKIVFNGWVAPAWKALIRSF